MKKFFILGLVILMTFVFSGCKNGENGNETVGSENNSTVNSTDFSSSESNENIVENSSETVGSEVGSMNTTAKEYDFKYLANTYAALTSGKKVVNVAFTGGSVTSGTGTSDEKRFGWPKLVCDSLAKEFGATIIENRMSIGGTGSYFGAFRYEYDLVKSKNAQPDLLFIEYAINDRYNNYSYNDVVKHSESLVRKAYSLNPKIDIVFVLVFDKQTTRIDYDQLKAHKAVAEKYGLLCINLREILGPTIKFAQNFSDDVHPNKTGYELYAKTILESIYNCIPRASEGIAHPTVQNKVLPTAMGKYFENMNLVSADRIDLSGGNGWALSNNSFSYIGNKYGGKVRASEAGSKLVIEFTGDEFGLVFDHGTKGEIEIKVDGKKAKVKSDNSSVYTDTLTANYSYSNPKTAKVEISSSGKHTVEITLIKGAFDIAAYLYN